MCYIAKPTNARIKPECAPTINLQPLPKLINMRIKIECTPHLSDVSKKIHNSIRIISRPLCRRARLCLIACSVHINHHILWNAPNCLSNKCIIPVQAHFLDRTAKWVETSILGRKVLQSGSKWHNMEHTERALWVLKHSKKHITKHHKTQNEDKR